MLRAIVVRAVKRVAKDDEVLSSNLQRAIEIVRATGNSYDKKFGDRKSNRSRTKSAQMFLRFGPHYPLVVVQIENRKGESEEFIAHNWKSYDGIERCLIRSLRWAGDIVQCVDAKNKQVFAATSKIT